MNRLDSMRHAALAAAMLGIFGCNAGNPSQDGGRTAGDDASTESCAPACRSSELCLAGRCVAKDGGTLGNDPSDGGDSGNSGSGPRDGGGGADPGNEGRDGGDGGASGNGSTGADAAGLPPVTDYTQNGPFATTSSSNTGPNKSYTIFRPDPLGANGFLHSPIIFGPGILTGPSLYTELLTHLASHGFVIICVNSLSGGPNSQTNLDAMKKGLEWLISQNGQPGIFQGKLAVDRAVTMGYSIGATASTQLSSHPAIMTTISIHGHNTKGDPHGPIWLLTGTGDVIDDNRTTLSTLDEAPAVMTALPIGHLNVLTEISKGGRYIAPITAWLRYWVNGDQGAKHFFLGVDCDVCKSPWITPETNDKWKALRQ